MLNKKIHIYCSNSYEVLRKEYPMVKSNLLDYDSENNQPRATKEISEKFMELLNMDSEILDVYTISDIPLNITGTLIDMGVFDCANVKVTFVGYNDSNLELIHVESSFTNKGYMEINWPFGCMTCWSEFYCPGYNKLVKKYLKNEK